MPGLQLLVSDVVGLRKAGLEVNASKCATMIIRVNRRCWYTVPDCLIKVSKVAV